MKSFKLLPIIIFLLTILTSGFLIFKPASATDASLLPPAVQQFFDSSGNPLASGKVYFYEVGTSTFKDTYTSSAATTPYQNPITLNAGGKPPGASGIYGIGLYRQLVKDRNGNTIWDAITSPSGSGGGSPTNIGDGNAVGTILPWSALIAPNQYVFAYGQELVRSTYPEFYTAITQQLNVSCSSASNILTGIADTSQIRIGSPVELSLCVSPGSTVVSKTGSSVTVSNPSSVSINTVATFFPYGNGNGTTTFNVPDLRGYVVAGRDNMGGTAAGRLTSTYFNTAGLGAVGGSQSTTISTSNLPATPLTVTISGDVTSSVNVAQGTTFADIAAGGSGYRYSQVPAPLVISGNTLSGVTPNMGSSTPFSNVQPTITINYIIKVTPDTAQSSDTVVTEFGGMTGIISCGLGLTCENQTVSATSFGSETIPLKLPVIVATTANIGLLGLQTIDGVSVIAGDRVLVKDQVTQSENGIYDVAAGAWIRATDFNTTGQVVNGTQVCVIAGSINVRTCWYITTTGVITIGTSDITFGLIVPQLAQTSTDNAIVRFNGTAGGTQNSGVTIADTNAVTIPSTATTTGTAQDSALNITSGGLGRGLYLLQTGTGTATGLALPPTFNRVLITSDDIDYGTGFVTGYDITHVFGGAATKGGREAFAAKAQLNATTSATNNNRNYVGVTGIAEMNATDGGTNPSAAATSKGAAFGAGFVTQLSDGATAYLDATAVEMNTALQTGSSAYAKTILRLAGRSDDVVQGVGLDAMMELTNQTAAVQWDDGILFNQQTDLGHDWPIKSTGALFRTQGTGTIATGFDVAATTMTTLISAPNNAPINYKNAAGSASYSVINLTAANNIIIGSSGFPGYIGTYATVAPIATATWDSGGTAARWLNGFFANTVDVSTLTLAANTSGDGAILTNATAATAGNQRYSPRIRLTGQGWKTTATAASQTVDWSIENKPVQGTTAPTTNLVMSSQINGGGYTPRATLTSTGVLTITDRLELVGNIFFDGPTGAAQIVGSATVFDMLMSQYWARFDKTNSNIRVQSGVGFAWSSSATDARTAYDTIFSRNAAGIVQIGTTAQNALGSLLLKDLTASGTVQSALSIVTGSGDSTYHLETSGGVTSQWFMQTIAASGALRFYSNGGGGGTILTLPKAGGPIIVNSAVMLATTTSFTNGAAAAAGTLLNAPAAGNPTKWIPIDDNGTTRYIPAW